MGEADFQICTPPMLAESCILCSSPPALYDIQVVGSLLTIELPCLQLCSGAFVLRAGAFFFHLLLELLCLLLKIFCLQWEGVCV